MDHTPTVILGGGIIGISVAYYLSEHQDPSTIHVVESAPEMFSSASGYAGGFLARDWHGPATAELGVLSFEEHRRLAGFYGGRERWGYSGTLTVGYEVALGDDDSGVEKEKRKKERGDDWLRDGTSRAEAAPVSSFDDDDDDIGRKGEEEDYGRNSPPWLRRTEGDRVDVIAGEGTTAQVDPLLLCRFLLGECVKRGVKIHHPARAVGVEMDGDGKVSGVVVVSTSGSGSSEDGKSEDTIAVPCTRLIITAGAWSGRVFKELFPKSKPDTIPVKSLAGHSIVFKSPRWHEELEGNGCHAVYTTSEKFAPEIYARLGGVIYFAGLNSTDIPLPEVAGSLKPYEEDIELLKTTARDIMGSGEAVDDLEVVRTGLCFRPVMPWGVPIISRIPDQNLGDGISARAGKDGGVYVATGHGPWGISLALGTGQVLAEMVQGRELSADISALGLRM